MISQNEIGSVLKSFEKEEGVYLANKPETGSDFEMDYIALRKKEHRLYTDDIVIQLPVGTDTKQLDEWKMRNRSAKRVLNYFQQRQNARILDLGCGNGWFSAKLANTCNCDVVGIDLNLTELKQAARVFKNNNLQFVYADIFQWTKTTVLFDFVTINAAVQYFPDFNKLINTLFLSLKEEGEIHIIDSPFYKREEVEDAKVRSQKYYSEMGFEKMGNNYFHHLYADLKGFEFEIIYKPNKRTLINKIFKEKEIPFPWIMIKSGLDSKSSSD